VSKSNLAKKEQNLRKLVTWFATNLLGFVGLDRTVISRVDLDLHRFQLAV